MKHKLSLRLLPIAASVLTLAALAPTVSAYSYSSQDLAAIATIGCPGWASAHNNALANGAQGNIAPSDCAGASVPTPKPVQPAAPAPVAPPVAATAPAPSPSTILGSACTSDGTEATCLYPDGSSITAFNFGSNKTDVYNTFADGSTQHTLCINIDAVNMRCTSDNSTLTFVTGRVF